MVRNILKWCIYKKTVWIVRKRYGFSELNDDEYEKEGGGVQMQMYRWIDR